MDFNSEIEKEEELSEEPQTLTSAEVEQIVAQKRDHLYQRSVLAAVLFCVAALALMASFKFNEDFFDASSRYGLLMESVNAQEENSAYPKINVKAEFDDKEEAKLVIPLDALDDNEDITISSSTNSIMSSILQFRDLQILPSTSVVTLSPRFSLLTVKLLIPDIFCKSFFFNSLSIKSFHSFL